jgi:hypothetical protein
MPDAPDDRRLGCSILEEIYEPEWLEWYRLTPEERWAESGRLWEVYRSLGGSLDPEPDYQSPFYFPEERTSVPSDGRPGLRALRRSGV